MRRAPSPPRTVQLLRSLQQSKRPLHPPSLTPKAVRAFLSLAVHEPDRKCRRFYPAEDRTLISLRNQNLPLSEIANLLNRSRTSCFRRHVILTRPPKVTGKWSKEEDKALLAAQKQATHSKHRGWKKTFAETIGRTPNSVYSRLLRLNSNSSSIKIAPAEVEVICAAVKAAKDRGVGIPWAHIGRKISYNPVAVRRFWEATHRGNVGRWSPVEDDMLRQQVDMAHGRGLKPEWASIGRMLGRVGTVIAGRWRRLQQKTSAKQVG